MQRRDWLYAEFLKVAETSGGRMTVEKQSFEQPKAQRIPQPTILTNIVATLKGTQPESADRVYVVSGHYDSMCTSPTDAKCDAPGANDDASGTAAVLEMARVMAKYQFDATIVFMTVPGEEQGLLDATHFAEEAKQKNRRTSMRCLPTTSSATHLAATESEIVRPCAFFPKAYRQMKQQRKQIHGEAWEEKMTQRPASLRGS